MPSPVRTIRTPMGVGHARMDLRQATILLMVVTGRLHRTHGSHRRRLHRRMLTTPSQHVAPCTARAHSAVGSRVRTCQSSTAMRATSSTIGSVTAWRLHRAATTGCAMAMITCWSPLHLV